MFRENGNAMRELPDRKRSERGRCAEPYSNMWHITTRSVITRAAEPALFPLPNRGASRDNGIVRRKERLGGLLKYYEREAA
jgi:hypothetical protein